MSAPHTLIGNRYGKFVVIDRDENYITPKGIKHRQWVCKCDCGSVKTIRGYSLLGGVSRSCGCLRKDLMKKHSMSKTPLYKVWVSMNQRCSNDKSDAWERYGGRGINVCARWKNSFDDFCSDMGARPKGASIDRINNDGNYEPGNCRWATPKEQANNRSTNINERN